MSGDAEAVDRYLDGLPEPQATTLRSLRATLLDLLPDADEGLSYGVPAVLVDGSPVAGYAGFTAHCGYYPHSGSVLQDAADLLDGYAWSKGTLRFPVDQPLPGEIVERLVALRLQQIGGD